MKLNRIKALCKAEHCCIIYTQGGRILIGTRNAAYPAEELTITPKSIKTLFDWPDVEEDILIELVPMKDSRICPMCEYKNQLIELHPGWEISYRGEAILPLMYEGGMFFVEQAYIAAAEKTEGYTSYHASENIDGEPLIIVGDGMITTAIIKPMAKREGSAIRDYLEMMTNFTVFGWPDEEKPEAASEESAGL